MVGEGRLSANEILDANFLENRARLLEIAAFLDRIDRALDAASGREDFRYCALRRALLVVVESTSGRAAQVQRIFSDPTAEPIASAKGLKAMGAWEERR